MRSRVIGGEFELTSIPNIEPLKLGYHCYASGRAALYQILKSIRKNISMLWLPDWLCESMIDAVKKAGVGYGFYTLGSNLLMNVETFVKQHPCLDEHDVIVLVNYFGLIDIEPTIAELRYENVNSVIIEDDVQALFSFLDRKRHSAEYRFTSLRKTIAATDGGLVKTNRKMPVATKPNTFSAYKLQGAFRKGRADKNTDDLEYLYPFEWGENLIEKNYQSVMSCESACIFAATDINAVAEKRKENARYLIEALAELGIEPLLPIRRECVPLFVPIMINNRNDIRNKLRQKGIFCPVHWPLREDMMQLAMGRLMAERELSLVVDQRYGIEDMQCIVNVIKDYLCKWI